MHANNKIMTNSLLENGRNEPGFVAAKSLGAAEHVKDRSSPAHAPQPQRAQHEAPGGIGCSGNGRGHDEVAREAGKQAHRAPSAIELRGR